jgi:hypothetical protein
MSDVSSLGPRVNAVEKELAVHEAVCSERYKQIIDTIALARLEAAERAARLETLLKAVASGLAAVALAVVIELVKRWIT